ncbi:hypothetical protein SAMN02745206_03135 [Desulfacinum infernum DSM 9756]|uniref:Uncharacterized protein n=1 Tax=Desulfacinum infernum DSM 9756 TaxID=1121391 RepID=A0A1M5GGW5_9BACT|nr:hypothetical protein SAMN02745206_03135 [Desulfacinum infernum DSM 9756]
MLLHFQAETLETPPAVSSRNFSKPPKGFTTKKTVPFSSSESPQTRFSKLFPTLPDLSWIRAEISPQGSN